MARLENALGYLLAVDSHTQCTANSLVLQLSNTGIDAVKVGAQIGHDTQRGVIVCQVTLYFVRGHSGTVVQLPGTEHSLLGNGVFNGIENNFIQTDIVCIPVVGVAFNYHPAVDLPLRQLKGTIAYQVALVGPARAALIGGAKFFNGRAMHWKQAVVIQQLQEVGVGFFNLTCSV